MLKTAFRLAGYSALALAALVACSGSSDTSGDGGSEEDDTPTGGVSGTGGGATGGAATGGTATGGSGTGGGTTGGASTGGTGGDAGSAGGGTSGRGGGAGSGSGGKGGGAGNATGGKAGSGGSGDGCPAGCPDGTCWQGLDGTWGCVSPPDDGHRTTCDTFTPMCCTMDSECAAMSGGRCVSNQWMYNGCGGPAPIGNSCYYDACTTDADCPPLSGAPFHVCVPGGAFVAPVSTCVNGGCRTDADCTTHPDGTCVFGEARTHGTCDRRQIFFCAYPSDPCQNRSNGCTGALLCLPNESYDGRSCAIGPPQYP